MKKAPVQHLSMQLQPLGVSSDLGVLLLMREASGDAAIDLQL